MTYDLLIAGAGPAGSSAAIYAARMGWKVLVVDGGAHRGSFGAMAVVNDFPGIANGTTGAAALEQMRRQASEAGVEFREEEITSTALGVSGKQFFSRNGAKFEGRAVILATGCCHHTSLLPGEAEFMGRGISYSVLRDGPSYRGKTVIVYGKSVEAVRAATDAARFGAKVNLVVPSSKLDLPETALEELRKNSAVTILFSASLKQIHGPDHVTTVTVLSAGQEKTLTADGIFLYHKGHRVDALHLAGTIDCAPDGMVLVNGQLETSIAGVFAAGDLLTGEPQIPLIAATQGVVAAISADRFLKQCA